MHLKVLGLSHKTVPIEIRENFSISKEKLKSCFENFAKYNDLKETVILSTCNRSEIYFVTTENHHDRACQLLNDLTESIIDKNFLYEYDDSECIRHLFEVTAGLDSLILGEGQILSQIKEAYSIAKNYSRTGTVLNTLFNRALATGKAVRTRTKISYNSTSVASAAVVLAERKIGKLSEKSALIFGAGKMAQLTIKHLLAHGMKKFYITNRHIENAQELASKIGGKAIRWEEVFKTILDVDLIITSTGAPHYVIKSQQIQRLMNLRSDKTIFLIDIAVPRDIDPEVNKITGVTLYNIDNLESVVEKNLRTRQEEVFVAEKIIMKNVAVLMERFKYLKFQPLMINLSEQAEKIRERELLKSMKKLSDLSEKEKKILDNMTHRIVRKLLKTPMMKLNASAGTNLENFYSQAVRALFTDENEENLIAQN